MCNGGGVTKAEKWETIVKSSHTTAKREVREKKKREIKRKKGQTKREDVSPIMLRHLLLLFGLNFRGFSIHQESKSSKKNVRERAFARILPTSKREMRAREKDREKDTPTYFSADA